MRPDPGDIFYFMLSGANLYKAIGLWIVGFVTFIINARYSPKKRTGIIVPILGLSLTFALLWLGFVCLFSAWYANFLGMHHDGYPYDLPLRDVPILALGTVTSLFIALLAGGVSVYRIRNFMRSRQNNWIIALD